MAGAVEVAAAGTVTVTAAFLCSAGVLACDGAMESVPICAICGRALRWLCDGATSLRLYGETPCYFFNHASQASSPTLRVNTS